MSVTFSQLLDAAETRMQKDASCEDLIQALISQLAVDLQASCAALTVFDGDRGIPLVTVGNGDMQRSDFQDVPVGRLRIETCSATSQQLLRTAATLAGDSTIILDVLGAGQPAGEELLTSVAEVTADLYRRRLLEQQVNSDRNRRALDQLLTQLHATLDVDVVANSLATDGAVVTGSRSISVAKKDRRNWTVVAGTGVTEPNNRSDAARRIQEIINATASGSAASDFDGLVEPLCPTRDWQDTNWAIVIDGPESGSKLDGNAAALLCHHGALAFSNCERYEATSFTKRIRRTIALMTKPGSLLFLVLICSAVAALFLVKTELRVEAYGELVPSDRFFVFAPEDGTIESVMVEDGTDVSTGDTLCTMSNEDLQVQRERVEGDLAATAARLVAIDALKGRGNAGQQHGLLSAEQLELREKSDSLEKQVAILKSRLSQLTLNSKRSGRVYGDQLKELLTSRPVRRGQFLFEVAAPAGEWQLELRVPELDIRHVLKSVEQDSQKPQVRYALETSPEVIQNAVLKSISSSTDVEANGQLSTLVIVDIGDEDYSLERPGTGVVAYVDCGRRMLGYVWFRKLIEFVQRNTWL